jgi:hypothetical protein
LPTDREERLKRHAELRDARMREEPTWRQLARLLRPDDQDFNKDSRKERDGLDTWDSTPLYALDNFVGGVFGEAVNPAERWFELSIDDKDLAKFTPVKTWLWDYAATVAASLSPGIGTFYTEAVPTFADMAGFGGGCMYQEELPGKQKIIDRVVPCGRVFRDVDASGLTNTVHAEYPYTGRQVKQRWTGKADVSRFRDDTKYTVIHCVYENADYRPRMLGPGGMGWESAFICEEIKDFVVTGGYHELPYHFFDWNRRGGRAYPSGPGHNALPDMNMLDEVQRSTVIAIQFEAEPILLVRDESIMTAADIEPHAVIHGGMTEQGKRQVETLNRGENLHLPLALVQDLRNQIREAFYFGLMQLINRPQMTATEFMGFKTEKLKLMAPNLVRIHTGLASFLTRRAALLWRAGQVPTMPPELEGRPLKFEFVSPFAKAQKLAQAQGAMQLGQSAIALQPLDPNAGDVIDVDNVLRRIADGYTNDPSLVRDVKDIEARRNARAQQQMQQQKLEQAGQAADIAATVSHAQQAKTLADKRSKAA